MTLMDAPSLFVTQTSPFARTAKARGDVADRDGRELRVARGVERADRIVVLVDDPEAVRARSSRSSKAMLPEIAGRFASQRVVHEHDHGRRPASMPPASRAVHHHVVDAGLGKRVLDRRRRRVRRRRRAVVEIPLVLDACAARDACRERDGRAGHGRRRRRRRVEHEWRALRDRPHEALAVRVDAVRRGHDDVESAAGRGCAGDLARHGIDEYAGRQPARAIRERVAVRVRRGELERNRDASLAGLGAGILRSPARLPD